MNVLNRCTQLKLNQWLATIHTPNETRQSDITPCPQGSRPWRGAETTCVSRRTVLAYSVALFPQQSSCTFSSFLSADAILASGMNHRLGAPVRLERRRSSTSPQCPRELPHDAGHCFIAETPPVWVNARGADALQEPDDLNAAQCRLPEDLDIEVRTCGCHRLQGTRMCAESS